MNRFHQIPTDRFVPISHDNSYLFNHYDKVANFLAFNLDKNYKNILAKPVQNEFVFDWFSVYDGLVNIDEDKKEVTDAGLEMYWRFIGTIGTKIAELSSSSDDDKKNWANLLTKVFNHKDNFIFSNGNNICIVWGWKFNNNDIYKPHLVDKSSNVALPELKDENSLPVMDFSSPDDLEENLPGEKKEDVEEIPEILSETSIKEIPLTPLETVEKHGFVEFLKWFASKFWWILWLLTFLAAIILFVKVYNINT